ncbi:hypothetical protein [Lysinibacillus fusiformis]|uniref:hypothetical protein n=1 Tax=Lysinibacillus fusiformis TaxID=28031 RepID=UPI00263BDEFA|nr:hypothetical protein [Lysinibacillus fusiformis]MDC6266644.1 hypothetical protein [Lysinibacillus sphaericus]MDN4970519.1 hypothetical protein [Lysinibacillus fusiformis]
MKISLICCECMQGDTKQVPKYEFTLKDDNVYLIECENGHKSVVTIAVHKFELLFEMGVNAFQEGYYREAVANFAASLERFYEFSIEFFVYKHLGIEKYDTFYSPGLYLGAWKQIKNQSERQLGAYTMLYFTVFNKVPDLLKSNDIAFRNDVIHKGYFPDEAKTLNYMENVFKLIQKGLIELLELDKEVAHLVYTRKVEENVKVEDFNGGMLINWVEPFKLNMMTLTKEQIRELTLETVLTKREDGYEIFSK